MAYCPKCKGEMDVRASVCPHCGYDFPSESDGARRRSGIAYSVWADMALLVGGVVAGFVCVGVAIASTVAVLRGDLVQGLVVGPISFFLSLAMLVVFLRVQRL